MSTVEQAAISYFGLPEGATLVEGGPVGHFAFIIPLTEEHLRGIADRMKAMDEPVERGPMPRALMKSQQELRAEYNAMSQAERGRFGSFNQYCVESTMGMAADDGVEIPHSEGVGGRKVQHVDGPVEEESGLPDAVWVVTSDLNAYQLPMVSEQDGVWSLIQVAMLTDEQRAKYVVK